MSSTTSSARRPDRRTVATAHAASTNTCSPTCPTARSNALRRLYGEDFLVDESLWRGRAPGRPFGLDGRDRPLEFRLLHVIEFAGNGDIKRENVWLDLAAILRQLPQD